MGRVEDALERSAKIRKGGELATILAEPMVPIARHDVETKVVPARYLDRFPEEAASQPSVSARDPAPQPASVSQKPNEAPDSSNGSRGKHPVIAADAATFQTAFSASLAEKLVVMNDTNPLAIEQYRKLAATLHQIQLERRSKVVMIASAVAGEGKTLTAMNLALTLSESFQHRVLLVDADLRRPQIHELFQVPGVTGLNEGLKSPEDLRLPVFRISSHLLLLPAGRPEPDPMRVLTSDRMRRVIAEASAVFDWVILDSPPVAHMPDAHLIASMIDLAVIVVAAGRTSYTAVARAAETLGRERVAGIVLNQVEDSALDATRELAYATLFETSAEGRSPQTEVKSPFE